MNYDQWLVDDFEAGDLPLSGGGVLHNARLHYHQIGRPNARKDNIILLPTYYGGACSGNHAFVNTGSEGKGPLDPGRYCIVIPGMLGAGESSSPSNTTGGQAGAAFPRISLYDNVVLQKKLIDTLFPGASLQLVMGWSMGGMQALQWAAAFPELVQSVLATCCTARCSSHNWLFLEGAKSALTCDAAFRNGHYTTPPEQGLRAFATVYAGWAYSSPFFGRGGYRELGFESIQSLIEFWQDDHLSQDANDLLKVLQTWQQGSIAATPQFQGQLGRALNTITMPAVLLPSRTDMYFNVDQAVEESSLMPGARVSVLESDWGHIAGGPGRNPAMMQQILTAAAELLQLSE